MYNGSGFVYSMSNDAIQNQVIAYMRDENGMLHRIQQYDTGGRGTGALSSYDVTPRSSLEVISASISNNQKATCWVSVDQEEQVAYTSNAGSDSISIYQIMNGRLTLRNTIPSDPNTTAAPLDNAVSCDGKNLYVLNGNEGTISVFRIKHDGNITLVQVFTDTGLPQIGAQGIAVI